MKLEILMSCMNQKNFNLINKSKIESDVLIINQTDRIDDEDKLCISSSGENFKARMISTKDRGLSKSRNLALKNSIGDICLISDDDQQFVKGYKSIVLNAFKKYEGIDIIAFAVETPRKPNINNRMHRIGYYSALRISSSQIAFRKQSIICKNISFDEKMGSGTGNGGGEETKFLYDCMKKGLKILYLPILIASVEQTTSQWANGFTKDYFLNMGWSHKRIKGYFFGLISILRFVVVKHSLYKEEIKFHKALIYGLKGVFLVR